MAIIEHLIGFLMQDFKKKIDMSFIDEDKKRKIIKQFQTAQESCSNNKFAHLYVKEEDAMDRLLNAANGVSVFEEFEKLLMLLEETYKNEIWFLVDESNVISGKNYKKTHEYKKLTERTCIRFLNAGF